MVIEGDQFGWVDEGEVEWVEEQDDWFVFEIGQFQFFDFVIVINGGCGEVWCLFVDENSYGDFFMMM